MIPDPVVGNIASADAKRPAQTMLRWGLQTRGSVIRAHQAKRIAENFDVFDFEWSNDEMTAISRLGIRAVVADPSRDVVTLEAFGREIPET